MVGLLVSPSLVGLYVGFKVDGDIVVFVEFEYEYEYE